jgi:hypothetical protein
MVSLRYVAVQYLFTGEHFQPATPCGIHDRVNQNLARPIERTRPIAERAHGAGVLWRNGYVFVADLPTPTSV